MKASFKKSSNNHRPVVGVIANPGNVSGDYPAYTSGTTNAIALSQLSDCTPIIIPANPDFISTEHLLEMCDGFLFTGGRPNVHPKEYGEEETPAHGEFDLERDALTIPLIRACVQKGQPFLGICRGFQEINVAMGGTLHPEIRELPGRMDHRMPPEGTQEEKFALRHKVYFTPGGVFANLLGTSEAMTNTLHGQGIARPGPNIVIEGWAGDDTPEAISIKDALGFSLAVQWHPEWNAPNDLVSIALFKAFGKAVHSWAEHKHLITTD